VAALLVYLLCVVISLSQAVNVSEALFEALKTILFVSFLLFATFVLRSHRESLEPLIRVIVVVAFIASFIGICQYYRFGFQWIPGPIGELRASTFANKNLFSSFLFLTLPFVLYGFYIFHKGWYVLCQLSTVAVLHAIIISQTRSVWVALFFSTTIVSSAVGWIAFRRKEWFEKEGMRTVKERSARLCVFALCVISIDLLELAGVGQLSPTALTTAQKAASIFDPENVTRKERLMLWQKTLLMIGDHPLTGVGAGNWKIVFPSYGLEGTRSESGMVHFVQPHNDYLWVAAETGITGVLAYCAVFIIALYYCVAIVIRSGSMRERILGLALGFGVLGYATISIFDFPKERIEHLLYSALMFSSIIATYDSLASRQMIVGKKTIASVAGITLVLSMFSIVVGVMRANSEIHTRRALASKEMLDWDGVIKEIDEGYSPCATMDPMVTPLPWYKGVALFSKNEISEAKECFQEALTIHPNHLHVLNNLATCYEIESNHEKAVEYYSRALAISPRFEESLLNLTAVYFNTGNYEAAYRTIMRCSESKDPRAKEFLDAVKAKLK
jgi:O-antigen ligase